MRRILGKKFFERPTLVVARDLIGKYLVRKVGRKTVALMIVETEGYFGFDDKGSHVYPAKGGAGPRQTLRNTPMFAPAGTIYVYFTYGMHWMLNLVCEKEDFPAAVLIRGLESPDGIMKLNGPAKLTKYLNIDRALNSLPLGKASGLWIEDRGVRIAPQQLARTPRIGIPNRGVWTYKPWRFILKKPLPTAR